VNEYRDLTAERHDDRLWHPGCLEMYQETMREELDEDYRQGLAY
jgi:hypothetical protein